MTEVLTAPTSTDRRARFVSADAHVTELISLYEERVDSQYGDQVPRIVVDGNRRTLVVEGARPCELIRAAELELAVIGGFDPHTRRCDQAPDGVSAEVVFPTVALTCCFVSSDPRLQHQLCRTDNSWAAEVFSGHPRLLAVRLVPMADVDEAIDEARWLAAAGFRALELLAPVPGSPYNPAYDGFWAVADGLGLPLTFSLNASELIPRQCAATFTYDPVALSNREVTGIGTLMRGNDYLHPEGTWPSSQDVAAQQFAASPMPSSTRSSELTRPPRSVRGEPGDGFAVKLRCR